MIGEKISSRYHKTRDILDTINATFSNRKGWLHSNSEERLLFEQESRLEVGSSSSKRRFQKFVRDQKRSFSCPLVHPRPITDRIEAGALFVASPSAQHESAPRHDDPNLKQDEDSQPASTWPKAKRFLERTNNNAIYCTLIAERGAVICWLCAHPFFWMRNARSRERRDPWQW